MVIHHPISTPMPAPGPLVEDPSPDPIALLPTNEAMVIRHPISTPMPAPGPLVEDPSPDPIALLPTNEAMVIRHPISTPMPAPGPRIVIPPFDTELNPFSPASGRDVQQIQMNKLQTQVVDVSEPTGLFLILFILLGLFFVNYSSHSRLI